MNRYPNLVGGSGALLSARSNGFLRRKAFTVAGSYTFDLPSDLPTDDRGLIRVMGFCIGGGAGGSNGNGVGSDGTRSGSGAGFSQKELWVPPGASFSVVVGAAGPGSSTGGSRVGGTSSITIDGKTWQATGGQAAAGGVGSGGDINTNGGGQVVGSSSDNFLPGASAGSPWGNGVAGGLSAGKWRIPNFWDLSDIYDADGFLEFEGIGMGSALLSAGPPVSASPATFGGGGGGGWGYSGAGAGGLAAIYW